MNAIKYPWLFCLCWLTTGGIGSAHDQDASSNCRRLATGSVNLVKDINPGGSSSPRSMTILNNKLYFRADDGSTGGELWESDGTESGTRLVKDINAGSASSMQFLAFIVFNDKLYFAANDGTHGTELWTSDGTTGGTEMVKDINPGATGSNPSDFAIFNNKLYFAADNGMDGAELWESDGTLDGTKLLKDINAGVGSSSPRSLAILQDKLFFGASDGADGVELWESDGTDAGTTILMDIWPGSSSSSPSFLTVFNNKLYFQANDGTDGDELWVTAGTAVSTSPVRNINPSGSSFPVFLTVYNNKLYFQATDGTNGSELWESDGTDSGTKMIKDINSSGSSNPSYLTVFNGKLYFSALDIPNGRELWESDGSTDNAQLSIDIFPGALSSAPTDMIEFDGKLYFGAAEDNTIGSELYAFSPTPAPTPAPVPLVTASPAIVAVPATPAPTSAPTCSCFSELATIQVQGRGTVQMKDLNVNDQVLVGIKGNQPFYQPVYAFGHYHKTTSTQYLRIYTNASSHSDPLEISSGHLLYVGGKLFPMRADSIQPGDSLQQIADEQIGLLSVTVTRVEKIARAGAYMPLTRDGSLIVNGILTSAYVSIVDDAPSTVSKCLMVISEDTLLHWWLGPYRLFCVGLAPWLCGRGYSEEGIAHWLVFGKQLAMLANDWCLGWQIPGIVIVGMLMAAFRAFEVAVFCMGVFPSLVILFALVFLRTRTTRLTTTRQKELD